MAFDYASAKAGNPVFTDPALSVETDVMLRTSANDEVAELPFAGTARLINLESPTFASELQFINMRAVQYDAVSF